MVRSTTSTTNLKRPTRKPCGLSNSSREGAALVEFAVVVPVFAIFLAGIVEFGHLYMVMNSLNAAAKKAARVGVADGISTSDVEAEVLRILSAAIDTSHATVQIANAGVFDTQGMDPSSINYDDLPTIELSEAEPRQLFIVRVSVPYDDVAVMTPFWAKGLTLTGQSVMRHE